ncbi:heparinase II/III domain-containing protein [Jiangella alkaliphila]|nr:heparinase II/III family protein [Jiangella alkaliphila]
MGWPREPESSSASLARTFAFPLLGDVLVARAQWRPFPAIGDRDAWRRAEPELARVVLDRAEAERGREWPVLPARLYARYSRDGDRTAYQSACKERRAALHRFVLAECLTGAGRFVDDVVDLVWAICEETSWSYPATSHPPRLDAGTEWDGSLPDPDEPVVDLFSAETGSSLAWTVYLLQPVLGAAYPRVAGRVTAEVRRRLLVPYRTVDEWRWLRRRSDGRPPSNWNAWIHSNLLAAGLLLEDDAYARAALVARIARGLDAFLDGYGADGGCDEGISYFWQAGARLFECLDLLDSATGGKLEPFEHPKLAELARFAQRMHVGGDSYVNHGDGSARQRQGGELLYRFGAKVGAADVRAHALAMRDTADPPSADGVPLHRSLAALFDTEYAEAAPARPPLPRDSWLPDLEVLTCRSAGGSSDGLFLAAKAGHNGESHGHNDVGSFVVAVDGVPAVVDVGVGVYTRATFSGERFGIWTMQSGYHNVPVVDGVEQAPGPRFAAHDVTCAVGGDGAGLRLDLAGAYPPEAGILRWVRDLRLDRAAGEIVLHDEFELDHQPGRLALHLMSWPAPEHDTGRVVLHTGPGRALRIEFDPDLVDAGSERVPTDDPRLAGAWGDAVHRIVLAVRRPAPTGALRIVLRPVDVQHQR